MKTKANPFPKSLAGLMKPELRRLLKEVAGKKKALKHEWIERRREPLTKIHTCADAMKKISFARKLLGLHRKTALILTALYPARQNQKATRT